MPRQSFPSDVEYYARRGKNLCREVHRALRRQVLVAYGGKCSCCGEAEDKFLTVDHINNDGAAHRREVGRGTAMYRWICRNDFPVTFQLLCYNCNAAKGLYGSCPHQATES